MTTAANYYNATFRAAAFGEKVPGTFLPRDSLATGRERG